ncbi:MAG TPA: BrnT family toxin [Candidatus Sulfotelmatobacter sp.]|nr:BrnT family toxin [Candidatus Sulfotelmatobacter sp.]
MFSWDPAKNRSNQKKHGVSFEAATFVFDDPFQISRLERIVEGEERWHTIGRAGGMLLLLVVHTFREVTTREADIRIISARQANKHERELYEEGA